MKLKTVIVYHLLALTIVLMLGCAMDGDLTRRIMAWQEAYPNRKGDCGIIAMQTAAKYQRRGYKVQLCHGYFLDEKHMWCEYYDEDTDTWLVDDPAIWYIGAGYPREAYKSGDVLDYRVTWTGEPNKEE